MPFTRRVSYAGNGQYRRLRKSDSTSRIEAESTNPDRERQLADLFRQAVTATLAQPDLQFTHLVRLLDHPTGHLTVADNMPWHIFETEFNRAQQLLVQQLTDGGTAETMSLGIGPFDHRDPNVLIYGAKHAADMVRHITDEQRRMLRNLVLTSELAGIAPKTLARDIRNAVGLTPKWETAVRNFHHGMLAKGVDPSFAAKQAKKYRDRLLTSRANMIARTEIMRATNEGKVEGWRQAIRNGQLTPGGQKQWHTALVNVCPVCVPMDKKSVALDDPFLVVTQQRKTYNVSVPPAHPHCRCTVVYIPPTAEDIASNLGLNLNDLVAEIRQGVYDDTPTPDPEEGVDYTGPTGVIPGATEQERLQERIKQAYDDDDLVLLPFTAPTPPEFKRTIEAEDWMAKHMGTTAIPEQVTYFGPTGRQTSYRLRSRLFDFEDLTPDLANIMVRVAYSFAQSHPYSWGRLTAYGTAQAIYRDDPDPAVRAIRVPAATYAMVSNYGRGAHRSLGWSKPWGTKSGLGRFIRAMLANIANNWHPAFDESRFNPVSAILTHEFAHVMHHRIGDIDPHWAKRLQEIISAETGLPASKVSLNNTDFAYMVVHQVSRYATSDWYEFVASAYAAFRTQPPATHSPLVRAVGRWADYYRQDHLL